MPRPGQDPPGRALFDEVHSWRWASHTAGRARLDDPPGAQDDDLVGQGADDVEMEVPEFGDGLRGEPQLPLSCAEFEVCGQPGHPLRQPRIPHLRGRQPRRQMRRRAGPPPRDIVADLRRTRRLDPQPVLTGMEASTCACWRHRPAHRTALGSPDAPPVLLVASAHDPVTPVEGARELKRLLPGSRLVTLDDDYSHGVFASRGNACVEETVSAYLVRGTVPVTNVRCAGPGLPE